MHARRNKVGLVWFRNDLRLQDHAALTAAANACEQLIPLYIFNRRDYGKGIGGFSRTGPHRKRFLVESVTELREQLRSRGSDLVIIFGLPVYIIPRLCQQYNIDAIYHGDEPGLYERDDETSVFGKLPARVKVCKHVTGSLLPAEALPFNIANLPDVFTEFKIAVERHCTVREYLQAPPCLPALPRGIDTGNLPVLELFLQSSPADERACIHFSGGECEGLSRVRDYIWNSTALTHYFDTRNELAGRYNSSKLSPWLANGSISPRYVYGEVLRFEQEQGGNKSTYWLRFELLWREFFRYSMLKHGRDYFVPAGLKIKRRERQAKLPLMSIRDVAEGYTGNGMIDALMNELKCTGYMSNRGRQMVASFLVNDLGINWLEGAALFEHLLIDYDVSSNYGNWAYVAGKGCDPRADRYFNIDKQVAQYDPEGEYRNLWLGKNMNYATHD